MTSEELAQYLDVQERPAEMLLSGCAALGLLETEGGRYFMRHTTVRSTDDLRFESALLAHLAEFHFPGPVLLTPRGGAPFLELEGEIPAALYSSISCCLT